MSLTTHNDTNEYARTPALWLVHDPWQAAFLLLHEVPLAEVEPRRGASTWVFDNTEGRAQALSRLYRAKDADLTVSLVRYHAAYRAALDAARSALLAKGGDGR